jgi:hypothetical protein
LTSHSCRSFSFVCVEITRNWKGSETGSFHSSIPEDSSLVGCYAVSPLYSYRHVERLWCLHREAVVVQGADGEMLIGPPLFDWFLLTDYKHPQCMPWL